jgi:NADH-quinone oxidoreductase subunit M
LIPLVIFMVWIGVRPTDFTKFSEEWVESFITSSEAKSIAVMESTDPDNIPDWTAKVYKVKEYKSSENYLVNINR